MDPFDKESYSKQERKQAKRLRRERVRQTKEPHQKQSQHQDQVQYQVQYQHQNRHHYTRTCLESFFPRDLIPIILQYNSTINFDFVSQWCQQGIEFERGFDAVMYSSQSIHVHKNELFLVDANNDYITIFHSYSGRFLRKLAVAVFHGCGFTRLPVLAVTQDKVYMLECCGGESEFGTSTRLKILSTENFTVIHERKLDQYDDTWPTSIFVRNDKIYVAGRYMLIEILDLNGRRLKRLSGWIAEKLYVNDMSDELIIIPQQSQTRHNRAKLHNGDKLDIHIQILDLNYLNYINEDESSKFGVKIKAKPRFDFRFDENTNPCSLAVHYNEIIVFDKHYARLLMLDRNEQKCSRILKTWTNGGVTDCFKGTCAIDVNVQTHELFVCEPAKHRVLIFN